MNKKWLVLGALAAFGIIACHPIFYGDLEVGWTVEDTQDTSYCSKYGIKDWYVLVEKVGMSYDTVIPCESSWDTGDAFHHIEEGNYTVTVTAQDENGEALAAVYTEGVRVAGGDPGPDTASVNFVEADFTGSGSEAKLKAYWNINGTTDGTDTGKSWDACSEVGAEKVAVTVDGKEHKFDCSAKGYMMGVVNVSEGSHSVSVKLLDSSGADLTTAASADVTATPSKPGQFIADFYYYSFKQGKKSSVKGDYLFTTTWGGKSCSGTSPQVNYTASLLKLDGKPQTTNICGPDGDCFKTNGADMGKCYPKTKALRMKNLTWGLYYMQLKGGLGSAGNYEVCWKAETFDDMEGKSEILVGAGSTNPTRDIDVPRISSSGNCAP